jgi:hypothetical protein
MSLCSHLEPASRGGTSRMSMPKCPLIHSRMPRSLPRQQEPFRKIRLNNVSVCSLRRSRLSGRMYDTSTSPDAVVDVTGDDRVPEFVAVGVMSPLEFLQRLAALVPRLRLYLIHFHGGSHLMPGYVLTSFRTCRSTPMPLSRPR